MTFLDQLVEKERALLKSQGRVHPADEGKPRPRLVVREIPVVVQPATAPAPSPEPAPEEPSAVSAPAEPKLTQTVGLHNVPVALVDALKAEAERRSKLLGKKLSMKDVALLCLERGLEVSKQDPIDNG